MRRPCARQQGRWLTAGLTGLVHTGAVARERVRTPRLERAVSRRWEAVHVAGDIACRHDVVGARLHAQVTRMVAVDRLCMYMIH
jgi:hypothetical protein